MGNPVWLLFKGCVRFYLENRPKSDFGTVFWIFPIFAFFVSFYDFLLIFVLFYT